MKSLKSVFVAICLLAVFSVASYAGSRSITASGGPNPIDVYSPDAIYAMSGTVINWSINVSGLDLSSAGVVVCGVVYSQTGYQIGVVDLHWYGNYIQKNDYKSGSYTATTNGAMTFYSYLNIGWYSQSGRGYGGATTTLTW